MPTLLPMRTPAEPAAAQPHVGCAGECRPGAAQPVACTEAPRGRSRLRLADRLGASASLVCALHCALLPLVIAAVPTLGLGLAGEIGFERGLPAFAAALAGATLVAGCRRHRTLGALMFLVPGVLAIWFGAYGPLGHDDVVHAVVMAVGGTLVAAAHLLNIRLAHGHIHDAGCGHLH